MGRPGEHHQGQRLEPGIGGEAAPRPGKHQAIVAAAPVDLVIRRPAAGAVVDQGEAAASVQPPSKGMPGMRVTAPRATLSQPRRVRAARKPSSKLLPPVTRFESMMRPPPRARLNMIPARAEAITRPGGVWPRRNGTAA